METTKGGKRLEEHDEKEKNCLRLSATVFVYLLVCLFLKVSFQCAAVSLPSSWVYPCQRFNSSLASEEQLYKDKLYLTPGWNVADDKETDYCVLCNTI